MTAWIPLWQQLPKEFRQEALAALLAVPERREEGRARAVRCISRTRGFRPQRLARLPDGELARLLASVPRPPAALVEDLLPALFLGPRQSLLTALLDRLQIPHRNGVLDSRSRLRPVTEERARAALAELAGHEDAPLLPVLVGTLHLRHPELYADLAAALEAGAPAADEAGTGSPEAATAETPTPAEELPEALNALDRLLIRRVVAALAEETAAMDLDEAEEVVDAFVHLNTNRHASYFHRGFLDGLRGEADLAELPEANDSRLAWLAAGWLSARARRSDWDGILDLFARRRAAVELLATRRHDAVPYGLPCLLRALEARDRAVEIPGFVRPQALACCDEATLWRLLMAATGLLRDGRHEQAAPLLDLLADALLHREQQGEDVSPALAHTVRRRRAHAFRLRGDFDRAREWLEPLQDEGPPWVRSQVLADLGLVECRIRSLAHLRLPEDGDLAGLAATLEPGLDWFRRAVEVDPHQAGHGAWCLGLHALGRRQNEDALRWLERAEAGFARSPETYARGHILPRARLALGLALTRCLEQHRARQARECLADGVRALGAPAMALAVEGLLALVAMSKEEARHLAAELVKATEDAPEARNRLVDEVTRDRELLAASPELTGLLRERARQEGRSRPERLADLRALLRVAARRDDRELADETLDALQAMAFQAPDGQAMAAYQEVLEDRELVTTAWEPEEVLEARAAVHRLRGEHEQAAALLEELAFAFLGAGAERVQDAADVVEELAGLKLDGYPSEQLRRRLAELQPVAAPPPSAEARGTVLFVGGNEMQEAYREEVSRLLAEEHPGVALHFEMVGWSSNWGRQVDAMATRLRQAGAVVLMRFVRTHLGREVRRLCGEAGIPWVACTGHGRDSMLRSIRRAIALLPRVPA